MIQEINKNLLVFLNSLTENKFIEETVLLFADAPIFFLPLFLVGVWLYNSYKQDKGHKPLLLNIFYGCILAIVFNLVFQQIFHFERPETALGNSAKLLLSHIPDASFPSDHAAVGFAFAFGLYFAGFKKTFYWFFPAVVLMGLSRVAAGVHWPLDVLAGAFVGLASSAISLKYFAQQKLVKKTNDFIIKTLSIIKL